MFLRSWICLSIFGAAACAPAAIIEVFVLSDDFSAAPPAIVDPVINLGDTIRWVWADGPMRHSTTSAAGQLESWDSGLHVQPHTFEHTFTNLGTFNYYCVAHGFDLGNGQVAGMAGSITVVPEPASLLALGAGGLVLARRKRR